jgi:hypothetical protein
MRANFFVASFPLAAGERFVILLPAKILQSVFSVNPFHKPWVKWTTAAAGCVLILW